MIGIFLLFVWLFSLIDFLRGHSNSTCHFFGSFLIPYPQSSETLSLICLICYKKESISGILVTQNLSIPKAPKSVSKCKLSFCDTVFTPHPLMSRYIWMASLHSKKNRNQANFISNYQYFGTNFCTSGPFKKNSRKRNAFYFSYNLIIAAEAATSTTTSTTSSSTEKIDVNLLN